MLFILLFLSSLMFSMPFPTEDDPPLIARLTDAEFDRYINEIIDTGSPVCIDELILMSRIRHYYRYKRLRKPQQSG